MRKLRKTSQVWLAKTMGLKKYPQRSLMTAGLALALALATYAPSAHANVYATNIKLNGGMTNTTVAQGTSLNISYILNEPASSGITIKILSGEAAVRTITIASGSGTARGLNTVAWDGKDDNNNPALGSYSVSVTAASAGYSVWTQILNNSNTKVYWPSGIAVDTLTNSPYYGRIMIASGVNTAKNIAPHPDRKS